MKRRNSFGTRLLFSKTYERSKKLSVLSTTFKLSLKKNFTFLHIFPFPFPYKFYKMIFFQEKAYFQMTILQLLRVKYAVLGNITKFFTFFYFAYLHSSQSLFKSNQVNVFFFLLLSNKENRNMFHKAVVTDYISISIIHTHYTRQL